MRLDKNILKGKKFSYATLIFVMMVWGISGVVGKTLLVHYSPAIMRVSSAAITIVFLGCIINKNIVKIDKSYWKLSLPLGASLAIAQLLEINSLVYTSPVKTVFYGNATCIVVPLFVALFTLKPPKPLKVLAGAVCFIGLSVISFGDIIGGGLASFNYGDALALLSGVMYGVSIAIIGVFAKDKDTLYLTFAEFCVVLPVSLAYALIAGQTEFSFQIENILYLFLVSGLLCSAICWWLRNNAVKNIDPSRVTIIMSFSGIVSGIVSILAGMEKFSWSLAVGGAICIGAVLLSDITGAEAKNKNDNNKGGIKMPGKIIFSDSAVLYWEPVGGAKNYSVFVNGSRFADTDKTHITLLNLTPVTRYRVLVECFAEDGSRLKKFKFGFSTPQSKNRLDITKPPYSAAGDGKTPCTSAIQRAIDDCTRKDCVYIPKGVFLSGALNLHSGTEIYLERGAVLKGSENVADYLPKRNSRFEGLEMLCYSSLINAGEMDSSCGCNCKDIIIRGHGSIAGGGNALRKNVIEKEREELKDVLSELGDKIKEYETEDTIPGRARPRLINLSNCKNAVISGITAENGPAWNLHYVYSEGVKICGCTFRSEGISNGDGIDPDSSLNSVIFDCDFYTGDDAIAIKSGKNPQGNIINRPCRNIDIFDCRVHDGHAVSVGSEMSGGVENIRLWDCDLSGSRYGFQIKGTKKRGGYVRNISVKNCKMPLILVWSVGYNDDGEGATTIPDFSDFIFEDCLVTGTVLPTVQGRVFSYVYLFGFDEEHPVKNVTFKNVGLTGEKAKDKVFMQFVRSADLSGLYEQKISN